MHWTARRCCCDGRPLLLLLLLIMALLRQLLATVALCALAPSGYGGTSLKSDDQDADVIDCDIAIAGGSTASLAAAITAAEADSSLMVCLTDWTDWPGGQMTAGGVPAIDFGSYNGMAENQPRSFREAMAAIPGTGETWNPNSGTGSGSPGACSVSTKCFLPNVFMETWVMPRLERLPNLRVLLRTTVSGVTTHGAGSGQQVTQLQAVRRTPRPNITEWLQPLSVELPDWYAATDSAHYTKRLLTIRAKVFIEATELGDVLATSGLPFGQGIEVPAENSTTYEDRCGQAQTLTFYMELLREGQSAPNEPAPPAGSDEGRAFPGSKCPPSCKWEDSEANGWRHSWGWRRSFDANAQNRSIYSVNAGDVSLQCYGNDLDTAYLFLPLKQTHAEAASAAGWRGGVNLTTLQMLENVSYGWFRNMVGGSRHLDPTWPERLVINRTTSGTRHGLSKVP
jgi:hypothetical protein